MNYDQNNNQIKKHVIVRLLIRQANMSLIRTVIDFSVLIRKLDRMM